MPEGGVRMMLETAASQSRPMRIKFGMDPTAPDLHLGHMVVLQRLRAFQDAGHTVVLIIGDFTARIGDPTGRSKTRPILSREQIETNAQTFCDQAFMILDRDRTEMHFNSEWLDDLGASGMLQLMGKATVSQLLARKDFADRLENEQPLSLVELAYPLLQGLDSVMVKADVEAGGQDQLLNLLAGRDMQSAHDQRPQAVICWPLLVGLDGHKKMSKSLGNHVALIDDAANQFGQIMSVADELMSEWADLLMVVETDDHGNTRSLSESLAAGMHPMQAKRHLAREILGRLHEADEVKRAEAEFDRTFSQRSVPDSMPSVEANSLQVNDEGHVFLPQLLVEHLGQASRSQARQTISGGGFRIDEAVHDSDLLVDRSALTGKVLRVGRKHWLRVV